MKVTARMTVESVLDCGDSRTVKLRPVYSNDPTSPNYSFSKYTPAGLIELTITNPSAWPLFAPKASIDIAFEPTPNTQE